MEKSARKKQDAEKEAANEMYEMIMKQNISASSEVICSCNAQPCIVVYLGAESINSIHYCTKS